MTIEKGTILGGRYEILGLLGQGGMGSVYEARHTGTRKRMALKVITADVTMHPGLVERFKVEARASGAIESQHIAQVFDVGADETLKVPYMAMEFLKGEDLEHLLARLRWMPQDLALRVVAQACAGLEMAHEVDVVHRDLKPANIYVTRREGEEIIIKLLDFGIAKILQDGEKEASSPGLTRTGSLLGSPLYMSPEQARGRRGGIDQRTDIWSMGVVLFQLLSGRTPNHDQEAMGDLIIAICSDPAPSVQTFAPWVSPEVADIIAKALEIDIDKRYQTIGEMLRDIRALLPDTRITPDMLGPMDEAARSQVAPTSTSRSGSTGDRPVKLATGPGGANTTDPGVRGAAAATSVGGGLTAGGVTTGALTTSTVGAEAAPPRSRSTMVVVGVAAVVALGVAVGATMFGKSAPPAPASTGAAVETSAPGPKPTQEVEPRSEHHPTVAPTGEPVVLPSGPAPSASVIASAPPRPLGGPRPTAPPATPKTAEPPAAPTPAAPPPKKNPLDVTIK